MTADGTICRRSAPVREGERLLLVEKIDHFAEAAAAGLLGRLHVHVLLDDSNAFAESVVPEKLRLGRDGEAFLLLFLG